ncbi:hypothetical protein GCK72_018975 [Caenorhabditis remanei]|uniref:Serpentine Receptor, class H n=1 Tax=Caenorhabditis remanei TaxID=31234 RepID=A0A6A5GBG1_CAERE|nr:hypothetical protein GCK72_018975 [Caenorhabditis remanei]KAF1752420.1 hypothetical protein GCK72_018975 [Caenorhabditis remanei]
MKHHATITFQALPCVPEFLFSTEIVVPTLEETVIIISLTVFIVVVFGQLVAFAAIIIGQLSSNFGANMLSGSTRRLQKNLLKALIWQTGIPFMYLVLPSCYTTFAFSADYFNMSNRTEISDSLTAGIKQTIQLWLLLTSICFVCVSTAMIFENRFRLLNHKNTRWKQVQPFWVLGNFLFCLIFQIPTILQVPDQDAAREVVFTTLPCIPAFLYSTEIVVPSLDQSIIIITSLLFIIVVFGQLITFAILIMVQLSTNFGARMLSENTRRLQKNLMKALIWQTGIPVLYLVFPASYAMWAISQEVFNRSMNNIIVAVTSLHGLVSTSSMILIHHPYRSTVVFWFKKRNTENIRAINNYPMFTTNTAADNYTIS